MVYLDSYKPENALFFDVEVVRVEDKLPKKGDLRESWEYKMRKEEGIDIDLSFKEKAALYGEFGKLVCVSLGRMKNGELVRKSYVGRDEKVILQEFFSDISKFPSTAYLVGHTINGYDIPIVFKRALINGLRPQKMFDVSHLKPWDRGHIVDLADLWRGTGYYNASLINMAVAFGIKHSKSDIDGSEVSDLYYSKDKDALDRIQHYCEEDVRVTQEVFYKMKQV